MNSEPELTKEEIVELLPAVNHQTRDLKGSQPDRLVEIALAKGIDLFRDQYGTPFVRIWCDGHREIMKCFSKEFSLWLAGLFWKQEHKAGSSETIRTAINVLAAQARYDSPQYPLHNRVAYKDQAIYYDLADERWRALRISPQGWQIIDEPPIIFQRFAHQSAQKEPVYGGSLRKLLQFTNLKNETQELLLLVMLVSYLIPDIPHPILVIHGPHGSAKTTHARIMRLLVDPSKIETLSLPHDRTELVQQLSHHYAPAYDNISEMPPWISDALCRAVTGEGHSKRELYTDDDDFIYQFRRCPILNGINVPPQRADLLNRSILMEVRMLRDSQHRHEEDYFREFNEERPELFGAMLDALSTAMSTIASVKVAGWPRMADFCRWGCAIAEALGYSQQAFLSAYLENTGIGHDEVIEGSQVAFALQCLMQDRDNWEGTPHELYNELESIAESQKLNTHSREWPKAANALTRRINEFASNLLACGISIETGDRTGRRRKVTIHKKPQEIVTTVTSSESPVIPMSQLNLPDRDGNDDISRPSNNQQEELPATTSSDWMREVSRRLAEIKAKRKPGDNGGEASVKI